MNYPTPNKSTPLDYAKYHALLLSGTLNKEDLAQEDIRQAAVNAWYVTEWLDKELETACPSLYRELLTDRDRWKALADIRASHPGFLARLKRVFFPS